MVFRSAPIPDETKEETMTHHPDDLSATTDAARRGLPTGRLRITGPRMRTGPSRSGGPTRRHRRGGEDATGSHRPGRRPSGPAARRRHPGRGRPARTGRRCHEERQRNNMALPYRNQVRACRNEACRGGTSFPRQRHTPSGSAGQAAWVSRADVRTAPAPVGPPAFSASAPRPAVEGPCFAQRQPSRPSR